MFTERPFARHRAAGRRDAHHDPAGHRAVRRAAAPGHAGLHLRRRQGLTRRHPQPPSRPTHKKEDTAMGRMVSFISPRVAEVVDEESKPLGAGRGAHPHPLLGHLGRHRADRVPRHATPTSPSGGTTTRRLFVDGSTSFEYPVERLGLRGGRRGRRGRRRRRRIVAVGDVIWGTWGHRSETIQKGERAAKRILDARRRPAHRHLLPDRRASRSTSCSTPTSTSARPSPCSASAFPGSSSRSSPASTARA